MKHYRTYEIPFQTRTQIGLIMSNDMQFYVFIDAENISYHLIEPLFEEIIKYGIISGKRAYADWSNPIYKNWPATLDKFGIRPYQQFHYDEDETDKAIIMDIMETVYSSHKINGICIIANDHIYGSIARRIRERGLYILGIGTRQASRKFVDSCNNFVYIDNIKTTSDTGTQQEEPEKEIGLEQLLIKAIKDINEEKIHLGTLGNMLKKINPAFDPRTYGHSKLITLLQSFDDIFSVKHDNRIPPVYYIEYIEKDTKQKIDGVISRWFPHPKFGFIKTDKGDYYFHKTNIENHDKNLKVEVGQKVKILEFQAPNNNGSTESERNGKASKVFFVN